MNQVGDLNVYYLLLHMTGVLLFVVKCSEMEFYRTFVTAMEEPGFSNRVGWRGDHQKFSSSTRHLCFYETT